MTSELSSLKPHCLQLQYVFFWAVPLGSEHLRKPHTALLHLIKFTPQHLSLRAVFSNIAPSLKENRIGKSPQALRNLSTDATNRQLREKQRCASLRLKNVSDLMHHGVVVRFVTTWLRRCFGFPVVWLLTVSDEVRQKVTAEHGQSKDYNRSPQSLTFKNFTSRSNHSSLEGKILLILSENK